MGNSTRKLKDINMESNMYLSEQPKKFQKRGILETILEIYWQKL